MRRLFGAACIAVLALLPAPPSHAAQPGAAPVVSPSCASLTEDHAALDVRRAALEQALAEKRAVAERTPPQAGAQKALRAEIAALEGDLVDTIFLLDCPQARRSRMAYRYARPREASPPQPMTPEAVQPAPEDRPGSGHSFGGRGGAGGSGGGGGSGSFRSGREPQPRSAEPAPSAEPSPSPSGAAPETSTAAADDKPFVEITSFYATNRKATGDLQPAAFYGAEDAERMQYGRMTVTIPATHRPGEIELPSLWRLEFSPDPAKHFVIKELTPLEAADAHGQIRQAVEKAGSRSVLLFVHGFNVTFAEAGMRTAQLAHDLAFPGVPMFMSWPTTRLYTHAVESVQVASQSLDRLFDDISALPFDDVYVIAHSMGTRLVTNVLADRQQRGADVSKIRELLLGAPDINAQVFKTQIAPALAELTHTQKTIYASSNDLALKASKAVHGYARVGDTAGGVFVYPGFDTIDCSDAAPLDRAWGHSYVFDSSPVLADLIDGIMGKKDAAERRLKQAGVAPALYWLLK